MKTPAERIVEAMQQGHTPDAGELRLLATELEILATYRADHAHWDAVRASPARPEASTFQCPGCRTPTATLAVTNNGMRCPHCQLRFWIKSEPTGLAAQTEAELREALDRVSDDLRDDPRAAELVEPAGNTGQKS